MDHESASQLDALSGSSETRPSQRQTGIPLNDQTTSSQSGPGSLLLPLRPALETPAHCFPTGPQPRPPRRACELRAWGPGDRASPPSLAAPQGPARSPLPLEASSDEQPEVLPTPHPRRAAPVPGTAPGHMRDTETCRCARCRARRKGNHGHNRSLGPGAAETQGKSQCLQGKAPELGDRILRRTPT